MRMEYLSFMILSSSTTWYPNRLLLFVFVFFTMILCKTKTIFRTAISRFANINIYKYIYIYVYIFVCGNNGVDICWFLIE